MEYFDRLVVRFTLGYTLRLCGYNSIVVVLLIYHISNSLVTELCFGCLLYLSVGLSMVVLDNFSCLGL